MRWPKLLSHVFDPNSRKVGFGWWLFIVATWLLVHKHIDGGMWQACVLMSGALVGGGTMGDRWLQGKLDAAKPIDSKPKT